MGCGPKFVEICLLLKSLFFYIYITCTVMISLLERSYAFDYPPPFSSSLLKIDVCLIKIDKLNFEKSSA